jgi:hypothetical protein
MVASLHIPEMQMLPYAQSDWLWQAGPGVLTGKVVAAAGAGSGYPATRGTASRRMTKSMAKRMMSPVCVVEITCSITYLYNVLIGSENPVTVGYHSIPYRSFYRRQEQ